MTELIETQGKTAGVKCIQFQSSAGNVGIFKFYQSEAGEPEGGAKRFTCEFKLYKTCLI